MKLRWRSVAVVVGIVLVILLLRVTLFRPRPIEVEVQPAGSGPVEDVVTNSQAGTVKSRRRARVGADRAGRVVAIPHREGSAVRHGAILLQLDPTSASVQLEVARGERDALRATVAAVRAAATLATQEFRRTEQLRSQNLVSQGEMDLAKSRLDGAEAELTAAEARLARAESAVRLAQDELDHLRVVAPFDGIVTQRYVEVGESVIPGQAVLEVMSPDSLYVSAPIDEIDIGRLSEGLPARVTLDPYRGMTWRGTVTRISAVVDDIKEQNRTLEVEVEVEPVEGLTRPKPGTSADVQIILDRKEGVLRVPTFAVAQGKRVLVARGGKAVEREVETGLRNWEWTEIRQGLEEGDAVITNLDRQGLKAGVAVATKMREQASPGTAEARPRANGSGP